MGIRPHITITTWKINHKERRKNSQDHVCLFPLWFISILVIFENWNLFSLLYGSYKSICQL